MSCYNPLERAIFTSEKTTEQNEGSVANDYTTKYFSCVKNNWSGAGFGHYITNKPDQGSCVKKYCYFTEMQWTDTDMDAKYSHFDCSSESEQLENGDWLVPEGSFCTGRCNDGFRMDSKLARLTCTNPIPFETIDTAEYEKLLAERFDYFDDDAVIAWGMTGDLWDAFEDGNTKTASTCYKVKDQDCGAFPAYAGDEDETGVEWNCDDGFNGGSKCDKRCIGSFQYMMFASGNQPKTETECVCKGTCKWSLKTSECRAKRCKPPVWEPVQPGACYGPSGEAYDIAHQDPIGYPEGSYCEVPECAVGFALQITCHVACYISHDTSFCKCDVFSCKFEHKKLNACIQASCSPDLDSLMPKFAEGISEGKFVSEHDETDVSNIIPSLSHFEKLDCPADGYWSGTGNSEIDGQLKPETICEIKCVDGFHIERNEPTTQCWQSFDGFIQTAAMGSKQWGPTPRICVPDGYTWAECKTVKNC